MVGEAGVAWPWGVARWHNIYVVRLRWAQSLAEGELRALHYSGVRRESVEGRRCGDPKNTCWRDGRGVVQWANGDGWRCVRVVGKAKYTRHVSLPRNSSSPVNHSHKQDIVAVQCVEDVSKIYFPLNISCSSYK